MPSVNIDIAPPMLQWIISQKQIETINTELMTKLRNRRSARLKKLVKLLTYH